MGFKKLSSCFWDIWKKYNVLLFLEFIKKSDINLMQGVSHMVKNNSEILSSLCVLPFD